MAFIKIQPPGVMPLNASDRKPVIKVIGGDSWTVDLNLYDPLNPSQYATPETTVVKAVLSETQFDDPIWMGEWFSGITQDPVRKDLCHLTIPNNLTERLRRGSYQFSVKVSDLLKTRFVTEAEGSFLVEYKPTSSQHSIPYKDNTSNGLEKIITEDKRDELNKLGNNLDCEEASICDITKRINAVVTILKK